MRPLHWLREKLLDYLLWRFPVVPPENDLIAYGEDKGRHSLPEVPRVQITEPMVLATEEWPTMAWSRYYLQNVRPDLKKQPPGLRRQTVRLVPLDLPDTDPTVKVPAVDMQAKHARRE